MTEEGEVVKVNKTRAEVKVNKKDECSKCGMCLFPKGADSITYSVDNRINAKPNDTVLIEIPENTKLVAGLLIFLIPLLLIGLAFLINYLFINVEIWILILSVIFILLWYTILAVIDKKLKRIKGFCPVIVKIIKENINEGDKGDNR